MGDENRDKIIKEIREVFAGVSLGDGVGLYEGQAIDDYEDAAACREARERDEKNSWEKIPVEDLDGCYSSLSFFDAAGMRFHLPAYLIADLKDLLGSANPVFHLTQLDDYARNKLVLLSSAQRTAARKYLLFMKNDLRYEFERSDIEGALETYWKAD